MAWIAGTAAILGSLMFLGSLLLWMVPTVAYRRKDSASPRSIWQQRLKLTCFAGALALIGIGFLAIVPFPCSAS